MNNVVAYVRVSSASQMDNTSIEMQKDKIELYCKLHNINLVKVFEDESKSGKSTDREAYNNMLDFIKDKSNNINGIVAYKSDRLHRSLYNLLGMIKELQELDISFVSITEQFDTSTAQGMLFLQMLGSFSEFERTLINERTKSGRVQKGKKNLYAGGRVPFGYMLLENDKLIINENEANIIKDIFKLRSKGSSLTTIGKKYNMSKQRVSYILKNKVYIGKYEYNGKVEKNKINFEIPRLVTDYMYNKVNK